MTLGMILGFINLVCAGLLAGEEFTIRYGVRSAITSLNPQAHIQLRQALILRLRILVPAIFALTLISGISVTLVNGFGAGFGFRVAGIAALIAFIGVTLGGTVPINAAALNWDAAAPPREWRALVSRWEQLDTVRCWLAIAAFVCFLMALV